MIYTAAQVRELAARLHDSLCEVESYHDEADALTAYADRLEQDEQTLKEGDVFTIENVYVVNPEFSERELGRREVLIDIAKAGEPLWWHPDAAEESDCLWCKASNDTGWGSRPRTVFAHKPDCLWLRATAALRETTPTP